MYPMTIANKPNVYIETEVPFPTTQTFNARAHRKESINDSIEKHQLIDSIEVIKRTRINVCMTTRPGSWNLRGG